MCDRSSPIIKENVITNNTSLGVGGGGLALIDSSPVVKDNVISFNSAPMGGVGFGGGIYLEGSGPIVTENRIDSNTAQDGAGIYIFQSAPTIRENRISGNSALRSGGGVGMGAGAAPVFDTNVIVQNDAAVNGGGIACQDSPTFDIASNTVANNSAGVRGGGIYLLRSSPNLSNNIVVMSSSGEGIFCEQGAAPALAGNDVWGNAGGDYGGTCGAGLDDISVDPAFEVCGLDYHITPGSPVIDAGITTAPGLPARDLDGDLRVLDGDFDFIGETDIGVDEFLCHDFDRDGYTNCEGDCNDLVPAIHPGAVESCDQVDNNCDCFSDEGFDPDGDGIGDTCGDNCPGVFNPGQQDSGSVGDALPDGIGDACQAGDVSGNGTVDEEDVQQIRMQQAGLITFMDEPEKCNVDGDPECNMLDVVILQRGLAGIQPQLSQLLGQTTGP